LPSALRLCLQTCFPLTHTAITFRQRNSGDENLSHTPLASRVWWELLALETQVSLGADILTKPDTATLVDFMLMAVLSPLLDSQLWMYVFAVLVGLPVDGRTDGASSPEEEAPYLAPTFAS
jgi:hypothetical protein